MKGGARSGAAALFSKGAAIFFHKHEHVRINIIYATPVSILLEVEQDGPRGQK